MSNDSSCRLILYQWSMPQELSTYTPADVCLRHTVEDASHHTGEETFQTEHQFEHHDEKCLLWERWCGPRKWNSASIFLYWKENPPCQCLKTTAGKKKIIDFFLSPPTLWQVPKKSSQCDKFKEENGKGERIVIKVIPSTYSFSTWKN